MADEHIPEPYFVVEIKRIEHAPSVKREWQPGDIPPQFRDENGYTKKTVVDKNERIVLRQEVTMLDINAVIAAVNGLTVPEPRSGIFVP